MRRNIPTTFFLCVFGLFLFFGISPVYALPAFPGAEGGGAESVGGRGGIVYEVTNLDSWGDGSLRKGLEMSGPRIIVFRVGGTIQFGNPIYIKNPYVTIAGQTAPGGGIQLSGGDAGWGFLSINTHDVVIRYIRIRKGYRLNSSADAVTIEQTDGGLRPERIVLDHVSMAWGSDEVLGIWGTSEIGGVHIPNNISIQNSILAEGLRGHCVGLLTGSDSPENAAEMKNIDSHRNLFAFNSHRNPLYKTNESRIINNIVYHWRLYPVQTSGGSFDIVGNLFKHPNPNYVNPARRAEIQVYRRGDGVCITSGCGPYLEPSIYAAGNSGPWHPNPSDNTDMVKRVTGENGSIVATLESQYRRSTPLASTVYPVSVIPVAELESRLLPIVGASRRLDCLGSWVSNRDAADERIVNNVIDGYDPNWGDDWSLYGVAHQNEVGGFPTIAPGTACTDTDHDGMSDQWETAKGLNPNNASDGPTLHTSGYSNLERYLNGESATTASCNTVTPANFSQVTYNSYGAPFDPFTGNTPLVNVTCTSADPTTINLTTGVTGDTTRIVYTKGYWYDPATAGWRQYAGTCTGALNGEWCQGSVSATITDANVSTASSTNPTYLVGMTCSVQGGGWKCGCRDTTCANFYWQVQGAGM